MRNYVQYDVSSLTPCGAFMWEDVTRLSDTLRGYYIRIRRGVEAVIAVGGFVRWRDCDSYRIIKGRYVWLEKL
jgi:hypothetical protein